MARVTTGPAGSLPLGCGCGAVCREGAWIIPVATDPSGVLVPEQGPVIAVLTTAPTGGNPGSWYNPGTDADGWRPYGEGEWGECKVILVEENPTGTLAGAAGTIAVLTAPQGTEGAPAVFFKPATAGTAWIKVPVILQPGQSIDPLPPPGTMRMSATGDLLIYVDATQTAEVPVTYLKTLYEAREKIASFMVAAPASIFAFDQAVDASFPLNTGIVAQTLDGVEYPEKVGALAISYDGTRAYQRRSGSGAGKLWRPLHSEIVTVPALEDWRVLDSPAIDLWKTGQCKIVVRGKCASAIGMRIGLRINPTSQTEFATYRMRKLMRSTPIPSGNPPAEVVTAYDELAKAVNVGNDDGSGADITHTTIALDDHFVLELVICDPCVPALMHPIAWKIWQENGARLTLGEGVLTMDGNSEPWDFYLSKIGFETNFANLGVYEAVTGFAAGSTMEITWP